ncbi:MAG: cytochrome c oxidase subunit II [Croceicoccus sp.]|nr:cytochrome c oxidase subunit II [Croceicoccus sp.]|tara:strand:- start:891 stop:1907 length:1017 start_codon:yes stop_codon:yes gene_type:complete
MGIRRAAQYATFAGAALMVSAGTALAAAAEATALPEDAVVGGYVPMKPTEGKGMPTPGAIGFQEQFSPIGEYGQWMHNAVLMPIITAISLLVLLLLLWVVVRYRTKANPKPSRTSHNTLIEVVWTLLPVLVLLGIAVPSMRLLASQYETAPEGALTVKVTGYQWYWGYTYPDYGGFEVISNMLPEDEALANGEPTQLAVDKRMVVPAGVPIRIQTIGADVIHSFAVPSLWFKLDAVPGRLNEKVMFIEEPGVYYGQCMELCGARHGFMPIAVEALPRDKFEQWVLEQPGGTLGEPAMTDVNMPVQEPESAVPGAAGAPRPDSALEEDVDAAEPAPTAA